MKNIFITFFIVILITSSISLISRFFDIQPEHYIPYVFWTMALGIFYLILDTEHENIFMKNI